MEWSKIGVIKAFQDKDILVETTGYSRNQIFTFLVKVRSEYGLRVESKVEDWSFVR